MKKLFLEIIRGFRVWNIYAAFLFFFFAWISTWIRIIWVRVCSRVWSGTRAIWTFTIPGASARAFWISAWVWVSAGVSTGVSALNTL
ncbi:hypothetical protein [Azovibrio restrictus]|uniref:hypothetical protein n=1 Tax=Azovibrio restrictus TaxID=146938 RepID=UPI0026EEB08D|nr:hypothetical protein [Azovibrio restrictus]MDD3482993.1 hypothetical protein [Azovibrio restrictus]